MAFLLGNDIACDPFSAKRCVVCTSSNRGSILSTSIRSGSSPHKPRITALPVPWPTPVCPREPNNSTVTLSMALNWALSLDNVFTKSAAARMGPTVCELEGPIPILNISKTLIIITNLNDDLDLRSCMYSKDSTIQKS